MFVYDCNYLNYKMEYYNSLFHYHMHQSTANISLQYLLAKNFTKTQAHSICYQALPKGIKIYFTKHIQFTLSFCLNLDLKSIYRLPVGTRFKYNNCTCQRIACRCEFSDFLFIDFTRFLVISCRNLYRSV